MGVGQPPFLKISIKKLGFRWPSWLGQPSSSSSLGQKSGKQTFAEPQTFADIDFQIALAPLESLKGLIFQSADCIVRLPGI